MGTEYKASVYLGVVVTAADIQAETTATETVCDHVQAEGQRFCPVCGTAAERRVRGRTTIRLKPEVARLAGIDPAAYDFRDLVVDESAIGAFRLYRLRHDAEDDDAPVIYGVKLGATETWPKTKARLETPITDIAAKIHTLTAACRELGIPTDRAIGLHTVLYAG